ncbi:hypothetical protein ACFX2F_002560 [Malus domestica]
MLTFKASNAASQEKLNSASIGTFKACNAASQEKLNEPNKTKAMNLNPQTMVHKSFISKQNVLRAILNI